MSDHCSSPAIDSRSNSFGDLFAWKGGRIVLLGERDRDRWVLARGWQSGDRLSDVRRWSFADSRRFAGQVRRLADEATGDHRLAANAGADARAWCAARDAAERNQSTR